MAADRITKLEQQLRADQGDQALRIRLNNLKAGAGQLATFKRQQLHEDQEDALRLIAKQYGQPAEKIVKKIRIEGLYITELDLQNPAQKKVKLTIPLQLIKLSILKCTNNKLTHLTIPTNIPLTILNCSNNQLTNLTIPPGTPLKELFCTRNHLQTLTIPANTPLTTLYCYGNKLTNLAIPPNTPLRIINCEENPLLTLTIPQVPHLRAPPSTQINYH